jgi:transposase-like protein
MAKFGASMPSSWPSEEGRVPHGPTCICRRCQFARRRQHVEATRQRRESVASDEVALHVASLLAQGWTQREIARVAGLSTGAVYRAKWRGLSLDSRTAEKILAVR